MREGTNVRIEARERGKLVALREVHNVWTKEGRKYIAEMMSLLSVDPDVPERDDRIQYIGFGMGGYKQNQRAMALSPPLSTVYPLGSTPHGSTGFTFRHDFMPTITSLELPVGMVATSAADVYSSGTATWRLRVFNSSDNSSWAVHPLPNVYRFEFRARLGTAFIFPPPPTGNEYPFMPLSEAGLYTSSALTTARPFEPPVAYVNFDTIQMSEDTDLFVIWDVTI